MKSEKKRPQVCLLVVLKLTLDQGSHKVGKSQEIKKSREKQKKRQNSGKVIEKWGLY